MKKENNLDLMATIAPRKAIAALAVPSMISTIVYVVYNLTDTFFVGLLGDYNQIAALTFSLPVTWIVSSVSGIFSAGASSYISRKLGESKIGEVKRASSFIFFATLGLSLTLGLLAIIFISPILRIAGAGGELFQITKDYTVIVLLGTLPGAVSGCMQALLSAEGRTKTASKAAIVGVFTNIALDPIFIFGFGMQIKGAAVATVIGSVASLVFAALSIKKSRGNLSLSIKDFNPDGKMVKGILSVGVVGSAGTIIESVAIMVVNVVAVSFGSYLVAAVGIVVKVYSFGVALIYGFSGGIGSFIGYNFGSKNFARMKKGIYIAMAYTTGIMALFMLVILLFPEYLVGIFATDIQVIEAGVKAIRVFAIPLPFMGVQVCLFGFLIASGKVIRAFVLSAGKTVVLFIPLIVLLTKFFGINGLIFAYPIADMTYIIVTISTVLPILLKLKNKKS